VFASPILIVGDNQLNSAHAGTHLSKAGFENVSFASSTQPAKKSISSNGFELVLIFVHSVSSSDNITDYLQLARFYRYKGITAIVTDSVSMNFFVDLLSAGINDLFLQGPHFDIASEVTCLLNRHSNCVHGRPSINPNSIKNIGFFRTLGLTQKEVEVLSKYAYRYPRYNELSFQIGKSPVQVRKCFCCIYDKLGIHLGIDNPSRLTQFLTLCSIYW
jgi:hypothetical protein